MGENGPANATYTVSEGSNTDHRNSNPHLDVPLDIPDKPHTTAAEFKSQIWNIVQQLNARVNQLPQMKIDLRSALESARSAQSDYAELSLKYDAVVKENESHKSQVKLLSSQISILEKKLSKQSSDHDDLTTRSMNQNLVFSFKEKKAHEDPIPATEAAIAIGNDAAACKSHVEGIIKEQLKAPDNMITVVRAHRLGDQRPNGKCAPIIARLTRREMVGEALKLGKNLTDSGIYINPQLPPSVAERRQFCRSDYMANRNKPGVTAKMSSDRLFINNQLQRHLLAPNLPDTDIDTFEPRNLMESRMLNNEHCNIQCFKSEVSSMEDVRAVYDSVLAKASPTPDSLIYAYRFDDGTMRQNFDSGAEGGMGFKVLRELQNKHSSGTMVTVGIWYNNRNAPLKGAGFFKNFYDVIGEVLT